MQRARKPKGHHQDSIPGSTAETIAAHVQVIQRNYHHSALQSEKTTKINPSYLQKVTVAIGGFHPSYPKNKPPSTTNIGKLPCLLKNNFHSRPKTVPLESYCAFQAHPQLFHTFSSTDTCTASSSVNGSTNQCQASYPSKSLGSCATFPCSTSLFRDLN